MCPGVGLEERLRWFAHLWCGYVQGARMVPCFRFWLLRSCGWLFGSVYLGIYNWLQVCMTMLLSCSRSVMSDSLWPHELQHTRLPSHLLSPRFCANSFPWNWWCHSTISLSLAAFFSCHESFPASGSFPVSWLFTSRSQSIGASAYVYTQLLLVPCSFFVFCCLKRHLSRYKCCRKGSQVSDCLTSSQSSNVRLSHQPSFF